MVLAATMVFEVRAGGNDNNGGGFNSARGGNDLTLRDSHQFEVFDGFNDTAGDVNLQTASPGFGSQHPGNVAQITGGANGEDGLFEIISVINDTTIELDRAPDNGAGALSGATVRIGGAFKSIGWLGKVLNDHGVSGMAAWMKSGAYTLTSATANVSGGPIDLGTGMLNKLFILEGYEDDRGDLGAKPVVNAGAITSINVFEANTTFNKAQAFINITVNGNSQAGVIGFLSTDERLSMVYACKAIDCPVDGFKELTAIGCEATGCGNGFNFCQISACWAHENTGGFRGIQVSHTHVNSIASNNTNAGFFDGRYTIYQNCLSYGNGGDGFDGGLSLEIYVNCIAIKNGGYGFNTEVFTQLINCAVPGAGASSIANSSGNTKITPLSNHGLIELTFDGDPFVDGPNDIFSPNDTAGGGALLRAAGISPPDQTGFLDVGAVQHADAVGGGGTKLVGFGGGMIG